MTDRLHEWTDPETGLDCSLEDGALCIQFRRDHSEMEAAHANYAKHLAAELTARDADVAEAQAKSRIDERQCDEMTAAAGDLATKLRARDAEIERLRAAARTAMERLNRCILFDGPADSARGALEDLYDAVNNFTPTTPEEVGICSACGCTSPEDECSCVHLDGRPCNPTAPEANDAD